MGKEIRKIVLAKAGFEKTPLGAILIKLKYELAQEYVETLKESYYCAIDDYKIELNQLPRIRTYSSLKKVINERAFIDSSKINESANKIISSYFNDGEDFDLIDRYSKEFKNILTLKIQDYLNFGTER